MSHRRHHGYNQALNVALLSITKRTDAHTLQDATGLPRRGFQAVQWAGGDMTKPGPFSAVLTQANGYGDVTIHDFAGFAGYLQHVLTRGHSRDTNRRQLQCAVRAWREAALVEGVGHAQWSDGLDEVTVTGVHTALKALPTDTLLAVRTLFDLQGGAVALEFLRTTPGYE